MNISFYLRFTQKVKVLILPGIGALFLSSGYSTIYPSSQSIQDSIRYPWFNRYHGVVGVLCYSIWLNSLGSNKNGMRAALRLRADKKANGYKARWSQMSSQWKRFYE